MRIHTIKTDADTFASIKEQNFQIMRLKHLPKEGDTLLHEHEGEQKISTVQDVSNHVGLKKDFYLVKHEIK